MMHLSEFYESLTVDEQRTFLSQTAEKCFLQERAVRKWVKNRKAPLYKYWEVIRAVAKEFRPGVRLNLNLRKEVVEC